MGGGITSAIGKNEKEKEREREKRGQVKKHPNDDVAETGSEEVPWLVIGPQVGTSETLIWPNRLHRCPRKLQPSYFFLTFFFPEHLNTEVTPGVMALSPGRARPGPEKKEAGASLQASSVIWR